MKKSLLILVAILMIASAATGKRKTLRIMQNSVPETETLADGKLEFVYKYSYSVDTLDRSRDQRESDNMLLQIAADGLSKFSSYKNLAVDSLVASCTSDQLMALSYSNPDAIWNGEFMTIYKNYPEGKLTHTEKVCYDWLRYEEDMPELVWKLTDSTANVLGYECKSARCSFRGREWIAFYTEEIPLTEGPWKLGGLPGLIMKASDKNGDYTFECIGINSKADRPITMYKVPYNNMKRREYYDTKHRYEINPYTYFEATTGGHITVTDEAGNPAPDAYEPEELPYGYIELDWRK